jgi:GNAT superfamily N-acetyltransferase
LYVDESHRGQSIGRGLIEYVAQRAKERNSPRLYWLTHQGNSNARILYDKVAAHSGFIRYERPIV